jgi:large subunit ribosomal protein L21
MYAVIESGSRQHRVEVGGVVRVDKLPAEVGAAVVFDRVLLLAGEDDRVRLGSPTLEGVRVHGTVLAQDRAPKILIYTYKHRQNSNRRRAGHRQAFTAVRIDTIEG